MSSAGILSFKVACPGPGPGYACPRHVGYVNGNAQNMQEAEQYALNAGWQPRAYDGLPICPSCTRILRAAFQASASALAPILNGGAPTSSTRPLNVPKLRASDLLTYCDHCGCTLVGEYNDRTNRTELRCPTTNAVRQEIAAGDTAEWPEWALEKLYRMCKVR